MRLSKNRANLLKKFSNKKKYKIEEALKELKELSYAKFDESIDIAVRLGIDVKKSDQLIRGITILPNGNGKVKRVLAICNSGDESKCLEAGADFAGNDEYLKKITEGWFEFDTIVTVPNMMVKFGKLGKILGPKGLMPNPKTGGVSMDIVKSIKEIKSGRVEFKNDKNGIIHNCIGKKSFDDQKIIENFNSFVNALIKARPSSVKGNFIKSISISSTMGPGFYIDYSY